MPTVGYRLLFRRLVTAALFKLFRMFFILIQKVVWKLNGTASLLRQAREGPRHYDQSAQVVDVLAFHSFCVVQSTRLNDFIYTHNRFESPQYIIDNDHVSLFQVDAEKAVFVEANEKNMLLWKSDYNAFLRLAQVAFVKRLIIVPRHAFHRLAESVGGLNAELVFLISTGRCGATLLNQVMENTERCVALSEPGSVDYLCHTYRNQGDSPELRQLTRDVVRLECRPYKSMQPPPLCYFLKISAPSAPVLSLMKNVFPSSRCLFLYRDTLKVAKSFYRVQFPYPSLVLVNGLGRLSASTTSAIIDWFCWPGKDFNHRIENDLSLGTLMCVAAGKTYLEMRRRGVKVNAVRYEELVGQPPETCRRLMEYCGLPVELAKLAVRGLDVDSQRNAPIAKEIIGNIPEPQLTEESKQSLNRILGKFGLPLLHEECVLEGTLMINT